MIKYKLLTALLFVNLLGYSQTKGTTAWNYTEQNELNSFSTEQYEVICGSLILTSICENDLTNIQTNQTISVDCVYNLQGSTIEVPEGVTFEFYGGSIFNGTLNFVSKGKIAGDLLNTNLTLTGDVSLIDTTFKFKPERWNIVQGTVNNIQATANKDALNYVIELTTSLGATIFEIDCFDAFFAGQEGLYTTEQDRSYEFNSIKLQPNMHLKMTDNTYLRVFPTNDPASRLISGYLCNNIKITGGNLIGDRYTHDYAPVNDFLGLPRDTHEFGSLIAIFGCQNVLIENVITKDGSGDSVAITGSTIRYEDGTVRDGHQQSENVIVRGNIFDGARRNNISAVDGQFIYIEHNQIMNAGGGEWIYDEEGKRIFDSSGTLPEHGIDLEAFRERDQDGNLLAYEIIQDVEVRENTFIGNQQGDVTVNIANDVLVIDNVGDNRMGIKASHNVTFQGNTLIANENGVQTDIGLSFSTFKRNDEELVYNIKILNNTISGFKDALSIGAEDVIIRGNTIEEFTNGITFNGPLKNGLIKDNTYQSDEPNSLVYFTLEPFDASFENVLVQNETGAVTHRPISLGGVNLDALDTQRIIFDNVNLTSTRNSPLYILNSNNITIQNSTFENGVEQINTRGIILLNNEIISVD